MYKNIINSAHAINAVDQLVYWNYMCHDQTKQYEHNKACAKDDQETTTLASTEIESYVAVLNGLMMRHQASVFSMISY